MIRTRSWRWPLAVALVLLATGLLVHLLTASASEPSLDDDEAAIVEDESSFDPVDLPEPLTGSVEALGPSRISRNPKDLLPPKLSGGKGPKREFAVRVIDLDGNGVAGAMVGVWTKNARHPYAKQLLASREAFFARYYPASPPDSDSLSWTWLVWADPTWADPVELRKTDEDGLCSVHLPEGKLTIAAAHATLGTSGRWIGEAWEALAGPGGSDPFELILPLAAQSRLSGRVVDGDGQPVGGAIVCVSSLGAGLSKSAPRLPRPVACDENGRFAFDIDARGHAYVSALGRGQWSTRPLISVEPDSGVDVTLRIGSAASLSGRVLDPKGELVAGAEVHADGPNRDREQTRSADDGSFTLALPQTGRWLVGAVKGDWLPKDAVTVDVGASEPAATATLHLVESASIKGRVHFKSGEPAAGLQITAFQDFRSRIDADRVFGLLMPIQWSQSDAEGLFELSHLHPAIEYDVSAGSKPSARLDADAKKVAPGTFVELEVEAGEPETFALDGRVVDDETGEPIPAFSVSVAPSRDREGRFFFNRELLPFRSEDGRFHVDAIRWSKPFVLVLAAGYSECVVGPIAPAAQTAPLEIRLGRPAQLDVSVIDGEGRGVEGATVLLKPRLVGETYDSSVAREATTDASGHALWVGLPPDTYSVQGITDDQRTPIGTVTLLSGGQHVHALTLDPAAKPGRLVVRTIDSSGEQVTGVVVRLMTYGSKAEDALARRQKTNAEGEATFIGLSPGLYSVSAEISDGLAFEQATVTAGASTTVELRPDDD